MLKLAECYIKQTSNGVDINEIKNLIEADGGKFIIVEDGKPTTIVMSFEEYKKKLIEKKINPVKRSIPKELESEGLKLEDLPL